ncbi:MAG: AAA family ATPase [Legionellaceae bacterium]|nr:AAA family ATPase [Legionellaceae bacterium]
MDFPTEYYTSSGKNVDTYFDDDSSGGELEPDMIFEGTPFRHQSISDKGKPKQKNIIINDWSKDHLSNSKLKSHVEKLIRSGFKVFQVDGDKLNPILIPNQIKNNPKVVFDRAILAQILSANQPKIPYEEAFVGDFSHFNSMLLGESSSVDFSRDICESNLNPEELAHALKNKTLMLNIGTDLDLEKLRSILPYVEDITIFNSGWDEEVTSKNIAFIKHNIRREIIRNISIRDENAFNFIYQSLEPEALSIRFFDSDSCFPDKADQDYQEKITNLRNRFTKIQSLEALMMKASTIQEVFGEQPEIKTLHLSFPISEDDEDDNFCNSPTFINVEDLKLNGFDKLVPGFLSRAQKLKKVEIGITTDLNITETVNFERLVDFTFEDRSPESTIKSDTIAKLMANMPLLERLTLKGLDFEFEPYFDISDLPNLRVLEINDSGIKSEQQIDLLAKAVNLEELYCVESEIYGDLENLQLPNLKKLVISGSYSEKSISTLLSSTTALEHVTLPIAINGNAVNLDELKNSIDNLQSLTFFANEHTTSNQLRELCLQIEKLNLPKSIQIHLDLNKLPTTNNDDDEGEDDVLSADVLSTYESEDDPFPALPSVTSVIFPRDIEEDTYLGFLQLMPNIQNSSFSLLNTKTTATNDTAITQLNLTKISELHFKKRTSTHRVYSFLSGCPNVETITIDGQNIEALLPDLSLKKLRKLVINGGKISRENLAKIMDAAPNLEVFELNDVENITTDDDLKSLLGKINFIVRSTVSEKKTIIISPNAADSIQANQAKIAEQLRHDANIDTLRINIPAMLPKLSPKSNFKVGVLLVANLRKSFELGESKRIKKFLKNKSNIIDNSLINIYFNNINSKIDSSTINSYLSSKIKVIALMDCEITGHLDTSKKCNLELVSLFNSRITLENLKAILEINTNKYLKIDLNKCTIINEDEQETRDFITQHLSEFEFNNLSFANKHTDHKAQFRQEISECFDINADTSYNFEEEEEIEEYIVSDTTNEKLADTGTSPGPIFQPYQPQPPSQTSAIDDSTWSQALLIKRLSAYLKLKYPDNPDIDRMTVKLNQGICNAVARYYANTVMSCDTSQQGIGLWNEKMSQLQDWDGKTLPEDESSTNQCLEELWAYTHKYYIAESHSKPNITVMSSVEELLKNHEEQVLHIENSWHITTLIFKDDTWIFYDPNYKKGVGVTFSRGQEVNLAQEIYRVLGHGLTIESACPLDCKFDFMQASHKELQAFFNDGGFVKLLYAPNRAEVFQKFNIASRSYNELEGIFHVKTDDKPFWQLGLSKSRQETIQWLQRCYELNPSECKNQLKKGFINLTNIECAAIKTYLNMQPQTEVAAWLITHIDTLEFSSDTQSKKESFDVPLPETTIEPTTPKRERSSQTPSIDLQRSGNLSPPPSAQERFVSGGNVAIADSEVTPFILDRNFDLYKNQSSIPLPCPNNQFIEKQTQDKSSPTNLVEFDHELLSSVGVNKLIKFSDDASVENYLHHLQKSPVSKSRGLFVINCINDLRCLKSSLYINPDNSCSILPPPSGPLYNFLTIHKALDPIIVVNWSNFSAKETVQANTILDDIRKADGVDLPEHALVIGLQNTKSKTAYKGSDFTSRHHEKLDFPTSIRIPPVVWPKISQDKEVVDTIVIDFYDDPNWQRYLYGSYTMYANAMTFEPSPFLLALQKNPKSMRVIFKNAPMNASGLRHAINSFSAERKLTYQGNTFHLPESLDIQTTSGYSFALEPKHPSFSRGVVSNYDVALNPESLSQFFMQFEYSEKESEQDENKLSTVPGFIEEHKDGELNIYLTRDITTSAWARLLDTAQKQNCKLNITLAPKTDLPVKLKTQVTIQNRATAPAEVENAPARLITSNDLRMSEKELISEHGEIRIVDVSELKKSDIFYQMSATSEETKFVFEEKIKDIWNAVLNGETVILKGRFSPELTDALAPLLKSDGGVYHNGQLLKPTGKLILLTKENHHFNYLQNIDKRKYSFTERLESFSESFKEYAHLHQSILEDYTYDKLYTLSRYNPYPEDPAKIGEGLELLPADPIDNNFDNLSEEDAALFSINRTQQLEMSFERMPITVISGKTGVGKSSFMHQIDDDETNNIDVFFGDIIRWAEDNSNNQHILFIDEANLENTDWSMFESLFSAPPSITYLGKTYNLTENHRVAFALNPASYGGVRGIPELFKNHPNVETFGPISNAYLFHNVLKPFTGENVDAGQLFLKVFQKIKSIDEQAISARELQMMGFLYKSKSIPEDEMMRAKHQSLEIGLNCLNPKHKAEFKKWFVSQFGELDPVQKQYPKRLNDFSLTASHHNVYDKLDDLISVRELKQQATDKRMKFGGISGLVTEGSPGVGKSHFIKQFLLSKGFNEAHIDKYTTVDFKIEDIPQKTSNHFYYLPATMNVALKMKYLDRAFHEGSVVILDEINTSDTLEVLERQINALLMGEDLQGRSAINPGFTLLGTQNPVTMAGRKEASLAIQRRLAQVICEDYSPKDMRQILIDVGLDEVTASKLLNEFLEARKANHDSNLSFRQLIRRAYKIVENSATLPDRFIQLPKEQVNLIQMMSPLDDSDKFLISEVIKIGLDKLTYYDSSDNLCFKSIIIKHLMESHSKEALRLIMYQIISDKKIDIPDEFDFTTEQGYLDLQQATEVYTEAYDKLKSIYAEIQNLKNEILGINEIKEKTRIDIYKLELNESELKTEVRKIESNFSSHQENIKEMEKTKNQAEKYAKSIFGRIYDSIISTFGGDNTFARDAEKASEILNHGHKIYYSYTIDLIRLKSELDDIGNSISSLKESESILETSDSLEDKLSQLISKKDDYQDDASVKYAVMEKVSQKLTQHPKTNSQPDKEPSIFDESVGDESSSLIKPTK